MCRNCFVIERRKRGLTQYLQIQLRPKPRVVHVHKAGGGNRILNSRAVQEVAMKQRNWSMHKTIFFGADRKTYETGDKRQR